MKAEETESFLKTVSQSPSEEDLPLFPLELWLYPGITLPLQIFEPRYLSMISERLKLNAGFGIVPICEGHEVGESPRIHPGGVEVRVVDWYQQNNGLLGIKVCGERRFRVRSTDVLGNNLLIGVVDYMPLEAEDPILDRHRGLLDLLAELKNHPHAQALELPEPDSTQSLSYQLSQLLPFDADKKMALLTAKHAEERLNLIAQEVFDLANA